MRSILLVSLLAAASLAHAHGGDGSVTANTAAISTSQTSAYAGNGGGLSISGAYNQQGAATSGAALGTGVGIGPLKSATTATAGGASSVGLSAAGNLSIGNASGSAAASGVSTSSIVDTSSGHTVTGGPSAIATGNAETITGTGAASGTNGLAISGGSSVASFDSGAAASQIKIGPLQTVDVASHALSGAATTPGVSIHLGTGTVQLQTEAAANAFGQAKVGTIASTSN